MTAGLHFSNLHTHTHRHTHTAVIEHCGHATQTTRTRFHRVTMQKPVCSVMLDAFSNKFIQPGRKSGGLLRSLTLHTRTKTREKNNTAAKMTKISHLIQEKIHLKSTIFSAGCSLPASCLRTLFFFIFVWLSDSLYTLYLPDFNTFSLPTRCLQSYRTLNDGWSAANSLTLSSEGFYVATRHGLT